MKMKLTNAVLTTLLCCTALVGDYVVFQSKYSSSLAFRAIADSTVHAAIGFFSSLMFFGRESLITNTTAIYNVILCTVVSSLIDIDHFIVAKSIYLKDLVNLKQRGIFHCTTFWLVLTAALLAYTYLYNKVRMYISVWMLIVAFASHHIRDANRRGLWLYPFGHTPALGKNVYVVLLATTPHLFSMMFKYMKPLIIICDDYILII